VEALAFSDEGQRLFSVTTPGTQGGKLQVWDGLTGMLLQERLLPLSKETLGPVVPMSFARGGKLLAGRTLQKANVVKVWSTADGSEVITCKGHALPVYTVRFNSDGKLLATAACSPSPDALHEIKVWDIATGKALATFHGKGRVFNLAFNPPGDLLAFGGQEGTVGVIDWQSAAKGNSGVRVTLAAHQHGEVSGLVFSGDGRMLASAGLKDRTVKIWTVEHLLEGRAHHGTRLPGPISCATWPSAPTTAVWPPSAATW